MLVPKLKFGFQVMPEKAPPVRCALCASAVLAITLSDLVLGVGQVLKHKFGESVTDQELDATLRNLFRYRV